jgi:multiple sugar transport system substrate-binding protein
MPSITRIPLAMAMVAFTLTVSACGGGSSGSTSSGADADKGAATGAITAWAHSGTPAEDAALKQSVSDFNASGAGVTVTLQLLPGADYPKTLTTTKPAELPDVFESDGPTMASLIYAQKYRPIDGLVAADSLSNQTASVKSQNSYDGKQYRVSLFDSGLGIYGNKKLLDAAGVKYPTGLGDAWTADQFAAAVTALAANDPDHKSLDIKENYGGGEWSTYGFSPIVNSAGSTLIKDNKAEGNLNSAAVVDAVKKVVALRQYVDPDTDDKAFANGRVALSWVGHWVYNDYAKALGDNLVVLPLPDFGSGTKSGLGSWAWGIGAETTKAAAAAKFLDFLVSDASVQRMTDGNGAPPATTTVLATSKLYGSGGPLELFASCWRRRAGTRRPPAPASWSPARPPPATRRSRPSSRRPGRPPTRVATSRRRSTMPPRPSTWTSRTTTTTP